ncbi:glycosyltransferase [Streptococcus iniae]
MATGDFIVFVDSDDWIDANHIEDLYTLLQKQIVK